MDILELLGPTMAYKGQVLAFKAEMLEAGSAFHGCNGLDEVKDIPGLGESVCIRRYWITL